MKLYRFVFLLLISLLGFSFSHGAVPVGDDGLPEQLDEKWIARFEQSYGTSALYLIEITDDGTPETVARLDLQNLNDAAAQFMEQHPGRTPSYEALDQAGLLPVLNAPQPERNYVWDEQSQMFLSVFGMWYSPFGGAAYMLESTEVLRQRILEPNQYVRNRWRQISEDTETPTILLRELRTREYFLENYYSEEIQKALFCQRQLYEIGRATEIFALMNDLDHGDPLDIDQIAETGYLRQIMPCPSGGEYSVSAVGSPPKCSHEGGHKWNNAQAIIDMRREIAEAAYNRDGNSFPPALALKARFESPQQALILVTRAIELWPDVPALRLERMAHNARLGRINDWTQDIDYLLSRFPAVSILVEIDFITRIGPAGEVPEIRQQIARLISDRRPDGLIPQLIAIDTFRKAGDEGNVDRIIDRMTRQNRVWGIVMRDPKAMEEGS